MIGNRIKLIRQNLNLNQAQFADYFGIKGAALGHWETEVRDIPTNVIIQIVEKFNVNPNWLLTGEGEMFLAASEPPDSPVSPETILKFTNLLEEEFQRRLSEYEPPKSIKLPNHTAPKNRPPESLAKDKPLDIIDNNVGKGVKLLDLHKLTAKKMGYVAAGYGAEPSEFVEEILYADQVLGREGEDLFSFTVTGESMIYAGIYPGDLIMVCPTEEPKIGDLILAKTTDGLTVKNYQKDNEGRFVLHPDNYHYPDIVIDKTVKIIGVVMSAVKIFKKNT